MPTATNCARVGASNGLVDGDAGGYDVERRVTSYLLVCAARQTRCHWFRVVDASGLSQPMRRGRQTGEL